MDLASATVLAKGLTTVSLFGAAIGEGILIGKALEGMGRNPDVADMLFTRMLIGVALAESSAIYALVIFFML